jgi:hypothetical protein
MTTQWVLGWWNLIFILPFGLGLLYLGLYTVSGLTFGDTDVDAGIDHDVDVHLDADGDASLEHDADAGDSTAHADANTDTDSDTDHSAGQDAGRASIFSALTWIGFGRVPASMVIMLLLLSWGPIGFCANRALIGWPTPASYLIAVAIAFGGSAIFTRIVTGLVAKYLPTTETSARRRHELLGTVAEALYPIDSTFGMACGRDADGQPFQVACRTEEGGPPVAKGNRIKLVAYSASQRLFTVVPAHGD